MSSISYTEENQCDIEGKSEQSDKKDVQRNRAGGFEEPYDGTLLFVPQEYVVLGSSAFMVVMTIAIVCCWPHYYEYFIKVIFCIAPIVFFFFPDFINFYTLLTMAVIWVAMVIFDFVYICITWAKMSSRNKKYEEVKASCPYGGQRPEHVIAKMMGDEYEWDATGFAVCVSIGLLVEILLIAVFVRSALAARDQ